MNGIGVVCNQLNNINGTTESSMVRDVFLGCATCWGPGLHFEEQSSATFLFLPVVAKFIHAYEMMYALNFSELTFSTKSITLNPPSFSLREILNVQNV